MTTLEQRVQTIEDINAIHKLKAIYCDACDDDHNGEAVAKLFVENGRWHRSDREPYIGKKAIADYMFSIRDAGGIARSAHTISNPIITIEGDTASADWRFTMTYTEPQQTQNNTATAVNTIIGRYQDTYVKIDGNWYFESITVVVEQRGSYTANT